MSMVRKQDLLIWTRKGFQIDWIWVTFKYTGEASLVLRSHPESTLTPGRPVAHDADDRPLTKCEWYKYE